MGNTLFFRKRNNTRIYWMSRSLSSGSIWQNHMEIKIDGQFSLWIGVGTAFGRKE